MPVFLSPTEYTFHRVYLPPRTPHPTTQEVETVQSLKYFRKSMNRLKTGQLFSRLLGSSGFRYSSSNTISTSQPRNRLAFRNLLGRCILQHGPWTNGSLLVKLRSRYPAQNALAATTHERQGVFLQAYNESHSSTGEWLLDRFALHHTTSICTWKAIKFGSIDCAFQGCRPGPSHYFIQLVRAAILPSGRHCSNDQRRLARESSKIHRPCLLSFANECPLNSFFIARLATAAVSVLAMTSAQLVDRRRQHRALQPCVKWTSTQRCQGRLRSEAQGLPATIHNRPHKPGLYKS